MPILDREVDLFPNDLLERSLDVVPCDGSGQEGQSQWFAMYTLARYEKKLMRQLFDRQIAYYAPVISKRYRSANGRVRTSYIPLLSNYVFVNGTEEDRLTQFPPGALVAGCRSKTRRG